jgi:tRNA (guanine9-N1)-methyltransferase
MQVVVLSPDAAEVLDDVSTDHVYVIGGIVDRTVLKYKSLFYASEHRVQACAPLVR